MVLLHRCVVDSRALHGCDERATWINDQNKDDGILSHLFKSELAASDCTQMWRHRGRLNVLRSYHTKLDGYAHYVIPMSASLRLSWQKFCPPGSSFHCMYNLEAMSTAKHRGCPQWECISPATGGAYNSSQGSFHRRPNVVMTAFSIYRLIGSAPRMTVTLTLE